MDLEVLPLLQMWPILGAVSLKQIFLSQRAIVLFNRNLPTRCHKTSLRAFISWVAGMCLAHGIVDKDNEMHTPS